MKILVIGSGGRLGATLAREYARVDGWEVTSLSRAQLDLSDPTEIRRVLGGLRFDVAVNCAALTQVDYCETHPDDAHAINARAVEEIARICAEKGARCVHISTDYVFDGEQRTPYTESDPARAINVYGESKLRGERALLDVLPEHSLIVRVSWVFGPDRPSFIDAILRRALETEDLQAIADKWSVPAYTGDIADYLRPLLAEKAATGVLHLANSGVCTWQEYGQHALDCAAAAGLPLKGRVVKAQAMADLQAFVARRPVYTVLNTDRLAALLGKPPRPWQEAVEEYVRGFYATRRF